MKVNGEGQASIMTSEQELKIYSKADPQTLTFLQLLSYTVERPTAILALKQNSCYYDNRNVREKIIIPGRFRKQSAGKKAKERQVPVNPILRVTLENYERPNSVLMFPSPRNKDKPLTYHAMRTRFENLLKQCHLESHNLTLYSFRRTTATRLAGMGLTLKEFMDAVGWLTVSSAQRYVESDPHAIMRAFHSL